MAADPILLDTGILVALLHRDDADHEIAVNAMRGVRGELLTTEAVLTESMYLMSRTIMVRYRDLPADFADATLVTLAEEAGTRRVLTLDRRGFSVYRTSRGDAFEILP